MSFDTAYDYSGAQTHLDTLIAAYQATSDEFQTKIDNLAALTGYDDKIASATTNYTNQKSVFDTMVARYQAVKAEIDALEALDSGDKDDLYAFQQLTSESTANWMARMLFNHTSILADADFIAILTDVTNTEDGKAKVAELICMNYPIDRNAVELQSYF